MNANIKRIWLYLFLNIEALHADISLLLPTLKSLSKFYKIFFLLFPACLSMNVFFTDLHRML